MVSEELRFRSIQEFHAFLYLNFSKRKKDLHCETLFKELFQSSSLLITDDAKHISNLPPMQRLSEFVASEEQTLTEINLETLKAHDRNECVSDAISALSKLAAVNRDLQSTPSSLSSSRSSSSIYPIQSKIQYKSAFLSCACVIPLPYTDWHKESHWLRKNILPTRSILEEIYHLMPCDLSDFIGLHIRMGQTNTSPVSNAIILSPSSPLPIDAKPSDVKKQVVVPAWEDTTHYDPKSRAKLEENRAASHYSHFILEVKRIWRRVNPHQKFFLCADNPFIYEEFSRVFQDDPRICWIPKVTYDRHTRQQISAIVDIWLLKSCKHILGSPWSSFTELIIRLSGKPLLLAGKDFGFYKYATWTHMKTMNLGDEIQSIAVQRFLPKIDYFWERNTPPMRNPEDKQKTKLIWNGWVSLNRKLIVLFFF
jgi:hypothetical protein